MVSIFTHWHRNTSLPTRWQEIPAAILRGKSTQEKLSMTALCVGKSQYSQKGQLCVFRLVVTETNANKINQHTIRSYMSLTD